jgi:hypothetical protein
MRKKVIFSVAVCAIVLTAAVGFYQKAREDVSLNDLTRNNMEALATINPDCPNGCVNGEGGCHCYRDYKEYAEAKWPTPVVPEPPNGR